MTDHDCRDLRCCFDHPRWSVFKASDVWIVKSPVTHPEAYDSRFVAYSDTHTEAFNYALKEATK